MTCHEITDFLMDFLDRELPAAQRAEFEEHLKACPPCVEFMQSYEQTRELGCRCYQEDEPPAGMPEELVQAILAARKAGDAQKPS
jgi:anti-sigma factor (TIGR02949 family)